MQFVGFAFTLHPFSAMMSGTKPHVTLMRREPLDGCWLGCLIPFPADSHRVISFVDRWSSVRKWFKRISPDREVLLANRWLRPIAHRLSHPAIWYFNRRNVARGVALGLFVGFVLPLGQIVVAALLAAAARGNLLVAAAATLVTNPFTFPPIYYAAYRTGSFLLGSTKGSAQADRAHTRAMVEALTSASLPTLVGLLLFAIVSAAAGFALVHLGWRFSLARQRRRRAQPGAMDSCQDGKG